MRMQGQDRLSRLLAWPLVIISTVGFWWPINGLWALGALITVLAAVALLLAEAIARKWFMGAIAVAGLGIAVADSWPPPTAGSEWEYVAIPVTWLCQLAVCVFAILSFIVVRASVGSTSG